MTSPEPHGPRAASGGDTPRTFHAALAPLLHVFGLDVLTAFTVGMVPPLLPVLAGDFGLSTVEAGLVNTVYAAGRLAGSYPASRIRARWGTRAAVFLGIAGLIAGSAVCGLAPTFAGFLVGRLVMGLGASAAFLAIFGELLEAAPGPWRGRLANAFEAMAIVSIAVGGVLGAAVARAVGWRGVFVAVGPLLLLGFAAWRPLGPEAGRGRPGAGGDAGAARRATVRPLVPVYFASLAMGLTWSGLYPTLVPLVGAAHYRLDATGLGWAMGAGYLAEVLGLAALGLVIDRVRREPAFLVGALSVTAGGLLLAWATQTGGFVVGLILIGAGFAVWMIPATVLADRAGTPLPPGHLAAYRIVMDTGMILGPLLLGGLAELAGDRVAVGVAGFVVVIGALAMLRR